MGAENITVIPANQVIDNDRLEKAINKLKRFDQDIILHLEQLADLAEKNKPLFNLGLNFLKRR